MGGIVLPKAKGASHPPNCVKERVKRRSFDSRVLRGENPAFSVKSLA
jgi:hypothetical protein